MTTLYDTLGVRDDATDDEIKRAYRKAAMQWHPDRNVGPEDVARAAFQEIKDAYAILSDPAQRKVYDDIFAEQMRDWAHYRQQEEQLRAEREAAAQAAADAEYAEIVTLAMRFATEGYNRDVVFGVLLGRPCDVQLANRVADSVCALHASRQAAATSPAAPATSPTSADPENIAEPSVSPEQRENPQNPASKPESGQHPASVFQELWQTLFGVRSRS
jgi:curved DNA-binding protein CbpA